MLFARMPSYFRMMVHVYQDVSMESISPTLLVPHVTQLVLLVRMEPTV